MRSLNFEPLRTENAAARPSGEARRLIDGNLSMIAEEAAFGETT